VCVMGWVVGKGLEMSNLERFRMRTLGDGDKTVNDLSEKEFGNFINAVFEKFGITEQDEPSKGEQGE